MLGRAIRDPGGAESDVGEATGLGLLPIETTFSAHKATHLARLRITPGPGWLAALSGAHLSGYEIHSDSNTVSNAIEGVTLTLKAATAEDSSVQLNVDRDNAAIRSGAISFGNSEISRHSFAHRPADRFEAGEGTDR